MNPRLFLLPFAALFELVLIAAALLLSHIDCRRALAIADWATLHLPDTRWYTRKRGTK